MPDTHTGMGMPIGAIIAAKDVIIPNAVGVDIGCGMGFIGTDVKVSEIKDIKTGNGTFIQTIVSDILRNIPVGFEKHRDIQTSAVLDLAKAQLDKYTATSALLEHIDAGYYQVGTLGGGNHFIEIQEDDKGYLGIMLHSGSRNFGKQVCDLFHKKAVELNKKMGTTVAADHRLAYFPVDTPEGQQYINWMNLALNFAQENREKMMLKVKEIFERAIDKHTQLNFSYTDEINAHHNYATLETHFGEKVWVHRKGAISAKMDELGIIPGAMGSYSYIVKGLGNEDSFMSSSHGAGRRLSRTEAKKHYTVEEVMSDLNSVGVTLGKKKKKDVAEESRFAYKDIDQVMENQKDLVTPIKKLTTLGVVKG